MRAFGVLKRSKNKISILWEHLQIKINIVSTHKKIWMLSFHYKRWNTHVYKFESKELNDLCQDMIDDCILPNDIEEDSCHASIEILKLLVLHPNFKLIDEQCRLCIAFLKGWYHYVVNNPNRKCEPNKKPKFLTGSAIEVIVLDRFFFSQKDTQCDTQ